MTQTPSGEQMDMPMSARRTESLDAAGIYEFVDKETQLLFGRIHVSHIIEKANLGVTLVDESNVITGHASLYDHPNCSETENMCWEKWLKKNFIAEHCDAINTLFLRYFAGKEEFSDGIIKEIIRTVFYAVPLLQYIILVVPSEIHIGMTLVNVFEELKKATDYNSGYQVYACYRHNYCPVLHIREARIEDHDDLMPIFNRHNSHLKEIYGEFFLAELIEAQDEGNKCIVADVDGTAVGFVSISSDIKTEILKENFELEVFNYFLKKIERKRAVVSSYEKSPDVKEGPQEGDEESKKDKDLLTPTGELEKKSLRAKSPMKSGRQRTPKLSSSHLEDRRPQLSKSKTPEIEYITETFDVESVFCIQLFCIDDKYEARSSDFLPAVFDLFPNKDFVVITVPHNVPEFPLLQTFQRVTPKAESTLGHELYLFNKHGLFKSFSVRPCKIDDFESIKSLTETIKGHADIMRDVTQYNDYRRDADGTRIHAFVAEVVGQVVGICVCRDEADLNYIRSHYNIEDFVYFRLHQASEHGHLHHFVLNPIFQHYSKYFLKEVLHLSNKSSLYYPIYPDELKPKEKPYSLVTCLSDLVPVSVRRQIIYPLDELEQNAPARDVIKELDPYALYHINRKLTLEPKVVVNLRIVVVGASTVGLSAIQTLVFCPHLCFNNLTLVSDEDAFRSDVPHELSNSFLPQNMDYNSQQNRLLSLSTWLNVIKGTMTSIDRENKIVMVNGGQKVPYDHLLLCTGQQFYTVVPTGANVDDLITTSEVMVAKQPQVHQGFTPDNVFLLNSLNDCQRIKHWIEDSFDTDQVIVYGGTLEAYICINGLLKSGVKGSSIHHVHPPLVPPSCFNLPYVDNVMKKEIDKLGIHTYHEYTLARWNHGKEESVLKVATFTSETKPLTLPCQAFICCHKKTVNYNAFKAINDSCLVYDGKLVINRKFQTNDLCILAAGPLTKFARRYHSENWTHENFNSREIGSKLAETVMELFDPTLNVVENEEETGLIPKYKDAMVEYCELPGDYFFFNVKRPSLRIPYQAQQTQPDYGEDLVTGENLKDDDKGYFRLHINQYKTVQDITCLSKKKIHASNLLCLYGIHERYLNDLVQRFEENLIQDFYKYFEESWCMAMYHDRFKEFRNEIREILSTPDEISNTSLEDKIRQMIMEDSSLLSEQKSYLNDVFIGSNNKTSIEERLNCFLNYNKYHLPMFARPGML